VGEGVRASLTTLRDVAGVTGSFVCTHDGVLIAREIPALFEDAVLAEAGSRLVRLGETFAAGGDELDVAVVRYGDYRLYLKWIAGGVLCIVIGGTVNMLALRTAASLVGRRIAPAVAHVQTESARGASPAASLPAPVRGPVGQAVAAPDARRFRGRDVS
jgi:predicted regulator of Ras-like GTPase activity (Roadblock/LC7/MglB family)